MLFDSSWRQWRFVESLYLPAGASGSKSFDGIPDVYELSAIGIPQYLASAGHAISISGKTVLWNYFSYVSWMENQSTPTQLTVFAR